VNPGFCENMEVTRVPPGIPSRTTSGTRATRGTRTTGWEPVLKPFKERESYEWL